MPRTAPPFRRRHTALPACAALTLAALVALTGCSDASASKTPVAVAPTTTTAVTPDAGATTTDSPPTPLPRRRFTSPSPPSAWTATSCVSV